MRYDDRYRSPIERPLVVTLDPLLRASPVIQVHAYLAFAAIGLGAIQLTAAKGTPMHRTIGWIWATALFAVAGSSLLIHTIRIWGSWSPIHLLSLITLVMVPLAVFQARLGNIRRHRRMMLALYTLALIVTGL